MRDGRDFAHWEKQMQEMLVAQARPASIIWTFYEDYAWNETVLFVGPVDRINNRALSRIVFDNIESYPFGIEITMITTIDAHSYCTIFGPRSLDDAQDHMINDIKLSIPERLPVSRRISATGKWIRTNILRNPKRELEYRVDKCMRKLDMLDARRDKTDG